MRRRSVVAIMAVTALTIGIGAGGAFAYWTSNGSGSGSASVGTAADVTIVAATGTVTTKLIPGGSADLTLTLDNPNTYSVTITGISQSGMVTSVGGTGCTTSDVSVPTQTGLSMLLASGSAVEVHFPTGASMGTASVSGCQNSSFHIPVTLTVQR